MDTACWAVVPVQRLRGRDDGDRDEGTARPGTPGSPVVELASIWNSAVMDVSKPDRVLRQALSSSRLIASLSRAEGVSILTCLAPKSDDAIACPDDEPLVEKAECSDPPLTYTLRAISLLFGSHHAVLHALRGGGRRSDADPAYVAHGADHIAATLRNADVILQHWLKLPGDPTTLGSRRLTPRETYLLLGIVALDGIGRLLEGIAADRHVPGLGLRTRKRADAFLRVHADALLVPGEDVGLLAQLLRVRAVGHLLPGGYAANGNGNGRCKASSDASDCSPRLWLLGSAYLLANFLDLRPQRVQEAVARKDLSLFAKARGTGQFPGAWPIYSASFLLRNLLLSCPATLDSRLDQLCLNASLALPCDCGESGEHGDGCPVGKWEHALSEIISQRFVGPLRNLALRSESSQAEHLLDIKVVAVRGEALPEDHFDSANVVTLSDALEWENPQGGLAALDTYFDHFIKVCFLRQWAEEDVRSAVYDLLYTLHSLCGKADSEAQDLASKQAFPTEDEPQVGVTEAFVTAIRYCLLPPNELPPQALRRVLDWSEQLAPLFTRLPPLAQTAILREFKTTSETPERLLRVLLSLISGRRLRRELPGRPSSMLLSQASIEVARGLAARDLKAYAEERSPSDWEGPLRNLLPEDGDLLKAPPGVIAFCGAVLRQVANPELSEEWLRKALAVLDKEKAREAGLERLTASAMLIEDLAEGMYGRRFKEGDRWHLVSLLYPAITDGHRILVDQFPDPDHSQARQSLLGAAAAVWQYCNEQDRVKFRDRFIIYYSGPKAQPEEKAMFRQLLPREPRKPEPTPANQ